MEYETPIGDLLLDLKSMWYFVRHGPSFHLMILPEAIQALKATGKFEMMDLRSDEEEHSIEMHLPYVRKIFEG